MKSYVKGVITGFLIAAVIFAVPAIAENIDALFNQVRINVNGVDQIQWGEDIDLGDGESAPSSILYNGTTYLPMRKLGELSGQKIYWNGDSNTVSMTGAQKDINVVAEKPDSYGNVWKYYTFKDEDDNSYLGVKDEVRGYERIYRIIGNVRVTEEEIYFFRMGKSGYQNLDLYRSTYLVKLYFNNDADTQDGEIIRNMGNGTYYAEIEDNMIFYFHEWVGSNANHTDIVALDYESGKSATYSFSIWSHARNISTERDNEKIIFTYQGFSYGNGGELSTSFKAVVFDKNSFTFGEQYKVEDNNETN